MRLLPFENVQRGMRLYEYDKAYLVVSVAYQGEGRMLGLIDDANEFFPVKVDPDEPLWVETYGCTQDMGQVWRTERAAHNPNSFPWHIIFPNHNPVWEYVTRYGTWHIQQREDDGLWLLKRSDKMDSRAFHSFENAVVTARVDIKRLHEQSLALTDRLRKA